MSKPVRRRGDAPPNYQSKTLSDAEKEKIHKEALERAEEAWTAERENIVQGRDCQKFYAGDQWDQKARDLRADRPVLTINRLPQFVRQMTGDLRKNPPAIKFLPAKGEATVETAEAYNGITRHIEQKSSAKDCYITATENAAIASQGAFRIVTEYSSRKSFDQDIRFKPIRDPFGFLIDPFAVLLDKSDMRYGFVFEQFSKKAYEAKWPGMVADDVPLPNDSNSFSWRPKEGIRVAEYWVREPVVTTLYEWSDGQVMEEEPGKDSGVVVLRKREVEDFKVVMYMMSGKDILSGPHEFPGSLIPICVVVGEEITMDGATRRKGMVHDARDPQRMCNYSRSAGAEAVALQPRSPFLASVGHIKGYETVWRTAGSQNHSFLPYNVDPLAPNSKPERSPPPIASQGLDTQYAMAAADLEAVTGIYKASLGAPSNETSGIAIARKQQEGDTGTFLYPDNLSRALGYAGRILAEIIPKIYDNERMVRILKEDGTAEMITVNAAEPEILPNGKPQPAYDLDDGEYDVNVTTGPSFASRRAEAWENMVGLAQAYPALMQVAGDLILRNGDFPGADELSKRFEKTLPPGLKDDEPVEPPPPTPEQQAAAAKDAATALKDGATTDKIVAETTKINLENAGMVVQIQTLGGQVQQLMQMVQQLATQNGQAQPPQPGMQPDGAAQPAAMAPEAPPQEPMMDGGGLVEIETLDGMGAPA